jgi:hypothetical protein
MSVDRLGDWRTVHMSEPLLPQFQGSSKTAHQRRVGVAESMETVSLWNLYYSYGELMEAASIFDVNLSAEHVWRMGHFSWLAAARLLVDRINLGNHYEMLESLLSALEQRNKTAIARTDWERRDAHECATPKIKRLIGALGDPGVAREIVIAEGKPFTAKAEVREFLERAETEVLVVDPYVGVGTLDCLRTVRFPIRLLTGANANSMEGGFDGALKAFQAEGFQIEVRQHGKLHDRHLVFNERCWLIGSSLKDAGRKAFHTTEIIDSKAEVLGALETKWASGSPYPPPLAAPPAVA